MLPHHQPGGHHEGLVRQREVLPACASLLRLRPADGERREHRLVQGGAEHRQGQGSCSRRPATTAARSCMLQATNIAFHEQLHAAARAGAAPGRRQRAGRLPPTGAPSSAPRRQEAAPDKGGWNLFITWGSADGRRNPFRSSGHSGTGDKAGFGWPNDARAREVARRVGARPSLEERKADRARAAGERLGFVPHASLRPLAATRRLIARTSRAWLPIAEHHPVLERREDVKDRGADLRCGRIAQARVAGATSLLARTAHAGLHHPPPRSRSSSSWRSWPSFVFLILRLVAGRPGGDHRRRQCHAANRSTRCARSSASTTRCRCSSCAGPVRCLSGDLGISIFSGAPVTDADRRAARSRRFRSRSSRLLARRAAGAWPPASPAAAKAGSWVDRALMAVLRARLLGAGASSSATC